MKTQGITAVCLSACLSACASLPAVDYQYTPAVGLVNISVVQSLACAADDSRLIISNAQPTVTPSYQADTSAQPWVAAVSQSGSDAADTDFTLSRWDDGRLKSINSVSTGQGETILKEVISIGSVAAAVVGSAPGARHPAKQPICARLKKLNKDGVVAITYSGQFYLLALAGAAPTPIPPASGSSDVYDYLTNGLAQRIGPMAVTLQLLNYDTRPAVEKVTKSRDDYIWVKLQKVELGKLSVLDQQGRHLVDVLLLVPSPKESDAWELPIPKARTFGKSTFAISVAESGVVTSVEYARGTGVPGTLNVLNAAATTAAPQTAAEELAQLKAQDDLIAENNRHALCLAQPNQCK